MGKHSWILWGGLGLLAVSLLNKKQPSGSITPPPPTISNTAQGVDYINQMFGSIAKKPRPTLVPRQQAGESRKAFSERFLKEIQPALSQKTGTIPKPIDWEKKKQTVIKNDLVGAINTKTGDVQAGGVGLGAFDTLVYIAKKNKESGLDSSKWISNLLRNVQNTASGIIQGAQAKNQRGEISDAEYQRIVRETDMLKRQTRAKINEYR